MKIDYDEIITKANTRKDALKQVESVLADAPEMLERLETVSKWFEELSLAFTLVDTEGQSMIPEKIRMALVFRNETRSYLERALKCPISGFTAGVKSLVEADNV